MAVSRINFVVIGDTHLAPGPRQADKLAALEQILAAGEQLRGLDALGGWIWPGDLFDTLSTPADRNALKEVVKRMAQRAPVVICYGNHDRAGDLDIFADLRGMYPIEVVAQPRVASIITPQQVEAAVFVLPYPHKGGLVGAGVEHEQLGQEARHLLEPVFVSAAAELGAAAARGAITLFMGHVTIGGAVASTGQPVIGREIELDPALLARLGNIPKFVNHIHLPQQLHGAYVPGSIAAMDFGEMEAKRFLVLECRRELAGWTYPIVESLPIATPAQYHVEGELTREGFTYQVTAGQGGAACPVPASWKGADVRVRYRYKRSEFDPMRVAQIHAEFAEARTLKVEGDAIREQGIRAPQVIAAVTFGDKLRRYFEASGFEITPSIDEKIDALQQLTAEQLLDAWRQPAAPAETAVA